MVGCPLRNDRPHDDLHARPEDAGLGGHRDAHRRAAGRGRRHALDRDAPLGRLGRLATLRQPCDPGPALHLRPEGDALRPRRRLPDHDPPDGRQPGGHRGRLDRYRVGRLRCRRQGVGQPHARQSAVLDRTRRVADGGGRSGPPRRLVDRGVWAGADRRRVDQPALRRLLQQPRGRRAGRRLVACRIDPAGGTA